MISLQKVVPHKFSYVKVLILEGKDFLTLYKTTIKLFITFYFQFRPFKLFFLSLRNGIVKV